MLFIGRTMNKETQLGRKEKGREKKKTSNPQCCAYYLWNLTVITESIPCSKKEKKGEKVQLRVFSHWPCMRLLPHPVLQRAEVTLKQ